MSEIIVKNIWAEDLFEWFYKRIVEDGGDGCGAIVCSNYKEVADWFIEWWMKEYGVKYNMSQLHPKHEYDNTVNFHNCNENFIFTNDPFVKLHRGEYVFIVEEDCIFGFTNDKVIKKI